MFSSPRVYKINCFIFGWEALTIEFVTCVWSRVDFFCFITVSAKLIGAITSNIEDCQFGQE